uniref:Uncharacterized protein n=1 Tax=Clastoptera arizonana TaxID=38151 RepID=A0A1B6DHT9_9HEMI
MIKLYKLLVIMLAMSGSRCGTRGSKVEGPTSSDGPHHNDIGSEQDDDEPRYDDDGSPHYGDGPQHYGTGPPYSRGGPPYSRGGPPYSRGGPPQYRRGPQNYGNAPSFHDGRRPFNRGRSIRYRGGPSHYNGKLQENYEQQQHDNYGTHYDDDNGPQDGDGPHHDGDGQTQYDDGSNQYGDGSPHTDYEYFDDDKSEYHDPKKLAKVVRKRQECLQHVVKFLLQELTWHNLTLEEKTICLRRALILEQGLLILCRRLLKSRGVQMKPLADKIKPVITSIDSYLEDFLNSNDSVNIQRSISNYKQVFIVQYDLFTSNIIQYNIYHDRLVTELFKIQEPDVKRRNEIMSKYVKKLEDNFNITDYVPDYYDEDT